MAATWFSLLHDFGHVTDCLLGFLEQFREPLITHLFLISGVEQWPNRSGDGRMLLLSRSGL